MNIEKKLKDCFSEITPPTDNETIVRNVIERAENMKNTENKKPRFNRAAVTAIAAAAVLAAATISVGAATGWSFNGAFGNANKTIADNHGAHIVKPYSEEEAAQALEQASAADGAMAVVNADTFDYLSGGKELDLWYDFDNFRLNIKGVCADDYAALVLYDIVFDEGFDHSPKVGWTAWETTVIPEAEDRSLAEQPQLGMVSGMSEGVISQEGNILHCYTMPHMFHEYTWGGKTMTLDFMKVYRYIPDSSEKDGQPCSDLEELSFGEDGLRVEIPIDFPIFETKTWNINKPVDLAASESNRSRYGDDLTGTVKYFSATPLSWRVYVEADTSDFVKGDDFLLETTAFADGKALPTISGEGSGWIDDNGQGETRLFVQPIDPADITEITVCGQTFVLE
ncbi:MAG: hypothetical protein ACI4XA_10545 [Oscillospiraceae bacterium]